MEPTSPACCIAEEACVFAPAAPAAPASDSAWTTIIIILACLRAGLLNGMLVAPSWAIVLEWKLAIDMLRYFHSQS